MWLIDDRRTSLRSLSGSDRDPLEPPLSKAGAGDRPAVAGNRPMRAGSRPGAARGTAVLVPPGKKQRAAMPSSLMKVIAEWRNRIETTFSEITDRMELARHGAHTFWGLLTRTAATIAAHTLLLTCLAEA
jgi:hypothetical protein